MKSDRRILCRYIESAKVASLANGDMKVTLQWRVAPPGLITRLDVADLLEQLINHEVRPVRKRNA